MQHKRDTKIHVVLTMKCPLVDLSCARSREHMIGTEHSAATPEVYPCPEGEQERHWGHISCLRTKHCCEGEDWLTAMPKHLLSPRGQDSITGKEGDETMPKGLCCSFHVPDVSQNVTGMAWYTDLTLKDNKAFSYFNWGFDLKIFYTMLLARMATVFSLGSTALCSKGPVTPHQQSMAQSMC